MLLSIKFVWDIMLCHWVFPDVVKEHRAFGMSATAHSVTQHYIPDDTIPLCDPDYQKNMTEEC